MIEKLIAAKAFTYGSTSLNIGDPFDAPRQDARVLIAIGRAKKAPEPEPEPVDDKPKRAYKRRDMVAEDGDEAEK